MKNYSRKEILESLHEKIRKKEPIIIGGAGVGIVAKCADMAGIDLLMAYNTGPFRMDGHPSCIGYMAYGDCNAITLDLGRIFCNVVKNTPVIAGVGVADPYRDIECFVDQLLTIGFSGITNVPTAGVYTHWFRERIDSAGVGYPEEVKMIRMCHKKDIFTIAYTFTEEELRAMIDAGVDAVGIHVGATSGGTVGWQGAVSMDEACETIQRLYEIAMAENPNLIVTVHGGPIEGPREVQECFLRTDVHGFIGASSIERLPLERAVLETVTAFKSLKLRAAGRGEEKK